MRDEEGGVKKEKHILYDKNEYYMHCIELNTQNQKLETNWSLIFRPISWQRKPVIYICIYYKLKYNILENVLP